MRIWLTTVLIAALSVPVAYADEGKDESGKGRTRQQAQKAHSTDVEQDDAGLPTDEEAAKDNKNRAEKEREATEQLQEAETAATANPKKAAELREKALRKVAELQAKAEELLQRAEAKAAELGAKGQSNIALAELEAAGSALEAAAELNQASREVFRKLGHLYRELGKEAVKVWVKGKPVQATPILRDGRTLIPLRALAEALDATVEWDDATRTVTFTRNGNTVQLQIGSNVVLFNGQELSLDVPAAIVSGRTVVPLRAVSELLEAQVDYDPETGNVIVVDPNAPPATDETNVEGDTATAGQTESGTANGATEATTDSGSTQGTTETTAESGTTEGTTETSVQDTGSTQP